MKHKLGKSKARQLSKVYSQRTAKLASVVALNKLVEDEMDNNDIHTKWVSPVIANFIEEVVKSTTFNTTVTGTYESDVLNVTETLTSTENNYGS